MTASRETPNRTRIEVMWWTGIQLTVTKNTPNLGREDRHPQGPQHQAQARIGASALTSDPSTRQCRRLSGGGDGPFMEFQDVLKNYRLRSALGDSPLLLPRPPRIPVLALINRT